MRRNEDMAEYADALIAIWDWESTGTQNMIWKMINRDKQIAVFMWDNESDEQEL
jgi:hypothetical protein